MGNQDLQIGDELSNLLTKDQQNILNNLHELYPQVPQGMTEFQIKTFVFSLQEFPTWYAIYYQCVLESFGRFKTIVGILEEIQETKIRNKIKQSEIKRLGKLLQKHDIDNDPNRWKIELLKHKIECNNRRIAMSLKGLEGKFQELKVFEEVRAIAKEKMGDVSQGDNKAEAIKWYIKFLISGGQLYRSLVTGDMKQFKPLIDEYLKNLSPEERTLYGETLTVPFQLKGMKKSGQ